MKPYAERPLATAAQPPPPRAHASPLPCWSAATHWLPALPVCCAALPPLLKSRRRRPCRQWPAAGWPLRRCRERSRRSRSPQPRMPAGPARCEGRGQVGGWLGAKQTVAIKSLGWRAAGSSHDAAAAGLQGAGICRPADLPHPTAEGRTPPWPPAAHKGLHGANCVSSTASATLVQLVLHGRVMHRCTSGSSGLSRGQPLPAA